MAPRAGVLVTGTEVLTGIIVDRNGPWLADQLRAIGVDAAQISVVGDRPEDLLQALEGMKLAGFDLIVTSGGLGPTADDLTAEVVGSFQGRESRLDPEVEETIAAILEPHKDRWPGLDHEALLAANRKQALVPEGATVLAPVGTAPGLVVPPPDGSRGPTVVVLPGPPRELQPMWSEAVTTEAFAAATAGAEILQRSMLRLFGMPESELAATLRRIEDEGLDLSGLEITTCLRRGEIEIATSYAAGREADRYEAFKAAIIDAHGDLLFSEDESTIDQIVAGLLAGNSIAIAESCTAGLLAARLADRPGASEYLRGGIVAYSNEAKVDLVGVDPGLIEAHGAVSQPVAEALASGVAARFDAAIGVGITGIAGPSGGTDDKPVGLVWFAVCGPGCSTVVRSVQIPGGRADVRERATTVALHLIRRALI